MARRSASRADDQKQMLFAFDGLPFLEEQRRPHAIVIKQEIHVRNFSVFGGASFQSPIGWRQIGAKEKSNIGVWLEWVDKAKRFGALAIGFVRSLALL